MCPRARPRSAAARHPPLPRTHATQLPYWMEVEAAERAKLSKAAASPDRAPEAAAPTTSAKKSRRTSPRRTAASPAQRAARAYTGY